jgi:hypothetical protein
MQRIDNALPFGAQSADLERRSPGGLLAVGGKRFVEGDEDAMSLLEADMEAQARRAYDIQGVAAFDCPKSAAALHEAGHAVVATAFGVEVKRAAIAKRHIEGRGVWLGRIDYVGHKWECGPETDPLEDMREACA